MLGGWFVDFVVFGEGSVLRGGGGGGGGVVLRGGCAGCVGSCGVCL